MTTLEAGRSDFHCLCLQLHKNKTKPPKDIKIREKKRKKMVKVWMLTCVDKHAHTHKQSRHRMCEPSCELELVSKAILNTINTMAHIVTLTHTQRMQWHTLSWSNALLQLGLTLGLSYREAKIPWDDGCACVCVYLCVRAYPKRQILHRI